MRILTIVVAFVLIALADAALMPDAVRSSVDGTALAPFVDTMLATLPTTIAVIAVVLAILILVDRPKSQPAVVAAAPAPAAAALVPPVAQANRADAEVVGFLAILQEKGRLVDFVMEDVAGYSDAQVGAAARVLHEGCRAALSEHFGIRHLREEPEGSKVTVPTGYAPDDYRLVGKIGGAAPFSGTLVHHGWKAEWVKLPRLLKTADGRLPTIAPAEVELG
jgi:hypothetical protein